MWHPNERKFFYFIRKFFYFDLILILCILVCYHGIKNHQHTIALLVTNRFTLFQSQKARKSRNARNSRKARKSRNSRKHKVFFKVQCQHFYHIDINLLHKYLSYSKLEQQLDNSYTVHWLASCVKLPSAKWGSLASTVLYK